MTKETEELLIESLPSLLDGVEETTVRNLIEVGAMQKAAALKFVIKNEYWSMKRNSDISTRSAIMSLSIRWNTSETTIKHVIYNSPQIKA